LNRILTFHNVLHCITCLDVVLCSALIYAPLSNVCSVTVCLSHFTSSCSSTFVTNPYTSIPYTVNYTVNKNTPENSTVNTVYTVYYNRDTANKIGTYQLAIAAKYHNVPFFAAVPTTTLDLTMTHGGLIHVEERPADELTRYVRTCIRPYVHETYVHTNLNTYVYTFIHYILRMIKISMI
jgi:hypothetical protein